MNKYIAASIFSILIFSGCISVTKELPPFSTYTLELDKNKINHSKNTGYSVSVVEPKSINSINNILISYSSGNYRSENYALSKWSDKPTKMLQYMMVAYLNETKNYNYVHSNKFSLPSEIQIVSELDSFTQYLEDDKAYIKFAIRVFLLQKDTLYTKTFSYKSLCDDRSAQGSVKAINKAVNTFLQELDGWIVSLK